MDNLYEAMVNRELKIRAISRGMTVAELEEELELEKALAESISSGSLPVTRKVIQYGNCINVLLRSQRKTTYVNSVGTVGPNI